MSDSERTGFIDLTWREPAGQAVARLLRPQLQAVLASEAAVVTGVDTDSLHDFRVAVRRTRTLLSELEEVFPRRTYGEIVDGFRTLGRVTGPRRDLDVFGLFLAEVVAGARSSPDPLSERVSEQARREQRRIEKALTGSAARSLLRLWQEVLDSDCGGGSAADTPIGELATERLLRALRKFLARSRRLEASAEMRGLHRLRIRGKRLRYLLEFFSSLFPGADPGELIDALKELQDVLGDLNDTVVQLAFVHRSAEELAESELAPVASVIQSRQNALRRQIPSRLAAFRTVAVAGWLGGAWEPRG